MPYGRGGAGNIEASQTPQTTVSSTNASISADLERQQQSAEDYAGTSHPTLHNQEYAHMGRGGAGNYYSPRELNHTGEFQGVETSHVLGDGTPAPRAQQPEKESLSEKAGKEADGAKAYSGRGGAGNYFYGVDEGMERRLRKKYEDEARKKEELKMQVEKGVDDLLPRPEKARVAGGEPF